MRPSPMTTTAKCGRADSHGAHRFDPDGLAPPRRWCAGNVNVITAQDSAYDAGIAYATERGRQDGTNAAGWYTQDAFGGRVYSAASAQFGAQRVLTGIDDGDPAVLDTFPYPDLSGQWADSLTSSDLTRDAWHAAGIAYEDMDGFEDATDICDAYETAFSEAVEDEIARAARSVLA